MSVDSLTAKADKLYEKGEYEKAFEVYKKVRSKDLGDTYASYCLGYMCYHGQGTAKHYSNAVVYFSDAGSEYPDGLYLSGFVFRDGLGSVAVDLPRATGCFKQAAEAGHVGAMYETAWMYGEGDEANINLIEALEWMKKAAAQGHENANKYLSEYEEKAAELSDQERGNYYYFTRKDYTEAVRWYKKAAEDGDAYSQFLLGFMYRRGQGVEKDLYEAMDWLKKAVKNGSEHAEKEVDTLKSEIEAAERAERAERAARKALSDLITRCENGDESAAYEYALKLLNGNGVQKDESKGYYWMRQAADNGEPSAKEFMRVKEKEWAEKEEARKRRALAEQERRRQMYENNKNKNYSSYNSNSSSSSSKPMSESERRDWKYVYGYDKTHK